jgi:hypothetical protein
VDALSQRFGQQAVRRHTVGLYPFFGFARPAHRPGHGGQMNDAVEAFQIGSVNSTSVRIPPDFVWTGCLPDQASDFVATLDQVAGYG